MIPLTDKYMNWTDSLDYCKENDKYLLGNIDLSNITSSCSGFNHSNQRWIGVVKEDILSKDGGNHIYSEACLIKHVLSNVHVNAFLIEY